MLVMKTNFMEVTSTQTTKTHFGRKITLWKYHFLLEYKKKIDKYAFDNIFHLTMNKSEFELTDRVLKKYISDYIGE